MPVTDYFRQKTLFSKILASCLIPFVIILVLLLWLVSSLLYNNTKEMVENESVFYANQTSAIVKSTFVDNSSALMLAGEQIKQLDVIRDENGQVSEFVDEAGRDYLANNPDDAP